MVLNTANQCGQQLRLHRRFGDVYVVSIQAFGHLTHHPIGHQLGLSASSRGGLKVGRSGLAGGEHVGVISRQAVGGYQPLGHDARQLGHVGLNAGDPFARDHQRWQVWVWEVAVVGRVFFGAHGTGFTRIGVKQDGGLLYGTPFLNFFNLPANLKVNGLLHKAKAVEVFNFAARAQLSAWLAHRHVGVTPKAALLHVAVANVNPGHKFVQLFGIGHGLSGRAHVGLGHDFQQRCASAVEVNTALANEIFVQ